MPNLYGLEARPCHLEVKFPNETKLPRQKDSLRAVLLSIEKPNFRRATASPLFFYTPFWAEPLETLCWVAENQV